jgi:aminoglycoside 6'-N-acetyltransferase I
MLRAITFAIKRVDPDDINLFQNIAPGVFDEPVSAERLVRYLNAPGHLMVLALDGGEVVGQCVGVLHYHPDKPTELYVDEVGTASTHRRRGIARAMMEELFAWAQDLGCSEAWLGTEVDNEPANKLYRQFAPLEDNAIQYYLFNLKRALPR